MKARKRRQDPDAEYNFWQPATDMMSALVFVLVLVIALLGLYLLSDYTGYEEPSSSSEEAASSGWNNSDPGGWYYDGGTGDGDGDGTGDGNGQYDQQIIQTGGGGGYGEDGIKTAVFVELIDDETERRIPEAGVRFELYRTDTTHLMNGSLQTLNTYYPEKINYREYETTEEGTFYLPEKIWQGSYYFHELSEPEGYDAADDTYYDVERMYDWPDPYVVQIRVAPCKNIIRLQMNDAETQQPVGGGTFRVIAAEDIVTKDGTARYTQGQQVDTITCDENGYGESKELYLGKYTVQQQSSPNYYTTMQQDLDVEVEKKNGEDPELHEIDTEKTKIILNVTDELTSSALEGVVFTVTNEHTGIAQTVTTDASGMIYLTDLDKSTTYHVHEQQAPENYRPDDTDYTVTVAADGRIDGVSSTTLNITNRILRVSIHTVDMVLRSDTAGEQLSLYNEQDQLLRSWTTNGSGQLFTDLTEGDYYVVRGKTDTENARKYPFTVQDTARQQNWNVPVFTRYSAVALAILAALAAGAIWLLVFLWGIFARHRKAQRSAAAQKEPHDQNEEKS